MNLFLCIGTAAALFLLDTFLKCRVTARYEAGALPRLFARGRIRIGYVKNSGLMMGKAKSHPGLVLFLPSLTVVLLAFLAVRLVPDAGAPAALGFGLLLGGGLNNLWDRFRQRFVTDYLNFPRIKKIRNLYFNLSDFGIFLGALFVCLSLL